MQWLYDVCKQLCGRGTAVLVLGQLCLVNLSLHEIVRVIPTCCRQNAANNINTRTQVNRFSAFSWKFAGPLLLVSINRIVRRWNQTGQKFAGASDIAQNYLSIRPQLLWLLVLAAYLANCQGMIRWSPFKRSMSSKLWNLTSVIVIMVAFTFKLAFTAADSPELLDSRVLELVERYLSKDTLVLQARVIFSGLLILLGIFLYANGRSMQQERSKDKEIHCGNSNTKLSALCHHKQACRNFLHEVLTLFLMTQSRAISVPLFLLFRCQASILGVVKMSSFETTVTSIIFQHTAFFAFGGSNAISSIDLSNAYNGISSYNVGLVGILTFLSNWVGPIWWLSATYVIRRRWTRRDATDRLVLSTLHVALSLFAVMVACTLLRTHLFVWTVFSPKLLYSMAWAVVHHGIVNTTLLYCLSSLILI